jgi:tartrate/fumarate subfamily iron-sulfur-dependent hydro-lyase beta chain
MAVYELTTPLKEEDVRRLQVGDTVYLSGEVFTGRSRIHRYIFDENHTLPPEAARRNAMVHVGPIMKKDESGWELVSFMPTSSLRFEKWGAMSVEQWGLRMIVGKTTMGKATLDAMQRWGCVHVSPQCVSPNLWHDSISIQGVELFEELGSIEACWLLKLDKLGPFIVDMDASGRNYFDELDVHVAKQRAAVLQSMGIPEDFTPTKLY